MTKKEFEKEFRQDYLPLIRKDYEPNGKMDVPARREIWNDIIDTLVRDETLPERALNWTCPW